MKRVAWRGSRRRVSRADNYLLSFREISRPEAPAKKCLPNPPPHQSSRAFKIVPMDRLEVFFFVFLFSSHTRATRVRRRSDARVFLESNIIIITTRGRAATGVTRAHIIVITLRHGRTIRALDDGC